jgi:multidrug/hemolysin transport system permease protein
MKVFFRDRGLVLGSLMGAAIVFILYVLFIGEIMTKGYEDTVPDVASVISAWAMSGVVAVVPVTVTIGAFSVMVNDRINRRTDDFRISPMRSYEIAGGHLISTLVIGTVMTLLVLVLAEAYVVVNGGNILSPLMMLEAVLVILLTVLSCGAIAFVIMMFINSSGALSVTNAMFGTMSGFLAGAYVPIGMYPTSVQSVLGFVPLTHSASLMRKVMMDDAYSGPLSDMDPGPLAEFGRDMGVDIYIGDVQISPEVSIAVLVIVSVVLFAVAAYLVSLKRI